MNDPQRLRRNAAAAQRAVIDLARKLHCHIVTECRLYIGRGVLEHIARPGRDHTGMVRPELHLIHAASEVGIGLFSLNHPGTVGVFSHGRFRYPR